MTSRPEAARVLVVGAGAIGGVTAAQLTRAGLDVTVLDANPEHVQALNTSGLLIDEFGVESRVRIPAVARADELTGRFDYGLVTLKSLYLDGALRPIVARGAVSTYVSMGNGLVQERVRALVGEDALLLGIVEWGATNLGPGHVRQTTKAPFVIGEADRRNSERAERLARILSLAAPDTRTTTNIVGQIWSKLLVNSTFSGLGAVGGVLYGEIVEDPVGRQLALRVWAEGHRIANALGVNLDEVLGIHPDDLVSSAPDAALERLMQAVAATKASMLQDLERGALTEVDVINGGVAATAERLGLEAPLNSAIVRLIHGYESGIGSPSPNQFAALASAAPEGPTSVDHDPEEKTRA